MSNVDPYGAQDPFQSTTEYTTQEPVFTASGLKLQSLLGEFQYGHDQTQAASLSAAPSIAAMTGSSGGPIPGEAVPGANPLSVLWAFLRSLFNLS